MSRVAVLLLVLPLGIISNGCEPSKRAVKNNSGPPTAPLPPEAKVGGFAGSLEDLGRGPNVESPPIVQPDDPNLERVKAGKGVGAKGRSLDEYEGPVVTPAKAYFAAKERIFFEIEFKANYDRWRVLEDSTPQNFDELKSRFLDPLGLTKNLPALPEGHKYVWDPATEMLLVERPRKTIE